MRKLGIDLENSETLVALTNAEYRALCELGVAWGEREIPIFALNLHKPPDAEQLAPALRAIKTWVAAKFGAANVSRLADSLHKLLGDDVEEREPEPPTFCIAKITMVTLSYDGYHMYIESDWRKGCVSLDGIAMPLIMSALDVSLASELVGKLCVVDVSRETIKYIGPLSA